jgi:hypothetical protein
LAQGERKQKKALMRFILYNLKILKLPHFNFLFRVLIHFISLYNLKKKSFFVCDEKCGWKTLRSKRKLKKCVCERKRERERASETGGERVRVLDDSACMLIRL